MSRLPQLDTNSLTPEQQTIYDDIMSGPRGRFGGPFPALLHAPQIADQIQALGAALRFNTRIADKLREIAILVIAKEWHTQVEWDCHVVIALKVGVSEQTINNILEDIPPGEPQSSERQVYEFSRELIANKQLSAQSYNKAVDLLGIDGTVELVSILGYYTLLAMVLNTFEVEADPDDGVPPEHLALTNIQ